MKTKPSPTNSRTLRLTPVFVIAAALLSGCSSHSTPPAPSPAATVAVPVSGTELDQANLAKVRLGETLKAYPVNRYVDSKDPNLLHEAHLVYRKETGATWNLSPHAPTVVPLGPVLAVSHTSEPPAVATAADMEQRISAQTRLMAALVEQNETLTGELIRLKTELARQKENPVATVSPATQTNTQ